MWGVCALRHSLSRGKEGWGPSPAATVCPHLHPPPRRGRKEKVTARYTSWPPCTPTLYSQTQKEYASDIVGLKLAVMGLLMVPSLLRLLAGIADLYHSGHLRAPKCAGAAATRDGDRFHEGERRFSVFTAPWHHACARCGLVSRPRNTCTKKLAASPFEKGGPRGI